MTEPPFSLTHEAGHIFGSVFVRLKIGRGASAPQTYIRKQTTIPRRVALSSTISSTD